MLVLTGYNQGITSLSHRTTSTPIASLSGTQIQSDSSNPRLQPPLPSEDSLSQSPLWAAVETTLALWHREASAAGRTDITLMVGGYIQAVVSTQTAATFSVRNLSSPLPLSSSASRLPTYPLMGRSSTPSLSSAESKSMNGNDNSKRTHGNEGSSSKVSLGASSDHSRVCHSLEWILPAYRTIICTRQLQNDFDKLISSILYLFSEPQPVGKLLRQ